MPRQPRLILSHSYYHIMTRGNNKMKIFKRINDYLSYLDLIRKYKDKHFFDLFHYCLMPNHTHFLIKTQNENSFSTFMKKLNLAYYHHFKKKYSWTGHFFQDRFKSQPVGKDSHFIQCGRYIELNPVRAGIANNPEDYQFSSFNFYANGKHDNLITKDMNFDKLGETDEKRRNAYKKLLISETVVGSYKKKVWGSPGQRYNESKKTKYHTNKNY